MRNLGLLLCFWVVELFLGVSAQTIREALLKEARNRINNWHEDRSLLEKPLVKEGIALTMLKHDLNCGGQNVPVGYAEFEVIGARPIDVFNTVMNVGLQPHWNTKCSSIKMVGDWPLEGARGWDNVFNLIFNKKVEFLVWQVADADFVNEEFWMATSTQNNQPLREKSPKQPNWIESDNCLGAYHIRKSPRGSIVVATQHVNTQLGFWFPFHAVLKVFPIAWKGMVDFVQAMSAASIAQSKLGWPANKTVAPDWMFPAPTIKAKNATNPIQMIFQETPIMQTAETRQTLRIIFTVIFGLCIVCCCVGIFGGLHACNKPRGTCSRSYGLSDAGSTCSQRSTLSDLDESEFDSEYCRGDSLSDDCNEQFLESG